MKTMPSKKAVMELIRILAIAFFCFLPPIGSHAQDSQQNGQNGGSCYSRRGVQNCLNNNKWDSALKTYFYPGGYEPWLPKWVIYIDSNAHVQQTFLYYTSSNSFVRWILWPFSSTQYPVNGSNIDGNNGHSLFLPGESSVWTLVFWDRNKKDTNRPILTLHDEQIQKITGPGEAMLQNIARAISKATSPHSLGQTAFIQSSSTIHLRLFKDTLWVGQTRIGLDLNTESHLWISSGSPPTNPISPSDPFRKTKITLRNGDNSRLGISLGGGSVIRSKEFLNPGVYLFSTFYIARPGELFPNWWRHYPTPGFGLTAGASLSDLSNNFVFGGTIDHIGGSLVGVIIGVDAQRHQKIAGPFVGLSVPLY